MQAKIAFERRARAHAVKCSEKNKKGKKSKGEYNMKSAATKVMCPGSYAEPGNVEEDGDDGDNGEEVDDVAEA